MAFQTLGLLVPERRSNPLENPAVPLGRAADWAIFGGGHNSDAAEVVNPQTAMQQATVNACIRLISESVASMSPILYEREGKGRSEAFGNPLHDLLALQPNPDSSAFTMWDAFIGSIALTGNGYLEITRSRSGTVDGLWYLHPNQTTVLRGTDGSLLYRTTEGLTGGAYRELSASSVIHVPWFSVNGVTGISVIEQARNAVGGAIAVDRFGSRFFANFAMPQLALITKKLVKPEEKTKMRTDWESLQSGRNQHRVAILDQEMDIKTLSMSNEDSQFLASRNMSRQEICGLFRIHPSQIGDTSRVAGETYAAQQLRFLTDCLRPWLNRIEQELTRKLLVGMPGYSIRHDISDRLKTDFKTQMDGFAVGRQWGFYTANEVRRELGQNPFPSPEADLLLVPVNMMNAERLSLPPTKPTEAIQNE